MKHTFLSILAIIILLTTSKAQLPQSFPALLKQEMPKVVEWRRYFHQHPELSTREVNTAGKVAELLRSWGLEVQTGMAKTGVKAILKGGRPGGVVALRADMDALPITEPSTLTFASTATGMLNNQAVGIMHACGHDAHMAILLGTAEVLSKMKKDVPGTVVFIFQPAEEGPPAGEKGGAPLVVEEGALLHPKVDVIFGLHIFSNLEAGTIGYKSGAAMASADFFTIKVNGKGSHGANPWLGNDPIIIAAQILEGLQHIVSRQEDITKAPAIITVGAINGGVRNNIIPESCTMLGTFRTFDNATQKDIAARIKRTAEMIAASAGATADVSIETKALVTTNPPGIAKRAVPALEAAIGADRVVEVPWKTVAEDFSFYGTTTPSFFFFLGGMPKGTDPDKAPAHHTAEFSIDESGFEAGVKAFVQLVFDFNKK
ncbi:amidohydrolase [Flavihumibacter fluvii]|uniref:amidohydrolase n=1 Tax=Flavihumibacter fluvii TaxID=2838157 RepID=UPI001BDF506E|nr:amidohydrolase [Flavihumibacter fluvii]ULQ54567.1 amidohydrolase [Flavihumibacter fluvii]